MISQKSKIISRNTSQLLLNWRILTCRMIFLGSTECLKPLMITLQVNWWLQHEIKKKINPNDKKDILKRFQPVISDCFRHIINIKHEEHSKWVDRYHQKMLILTNEYETLLDQGRDLISYLREEMNQFKQKGDLKKIKLSKQQKSQSLLKKKVESFSVHHDKITSENTTFKPIDVMMKDNPRKLQRTQCLRQRNLNNLSNNSKNNQMTVLKKTD
mmetsp:Transcript_50650/g.64886  ORF Transcript_50650/g.64886 Transcript_50650/m.64886 type:complete len:214 (+) Transcript_50650:41-682(+)